MKPTIQSNSDETKGNIKKNSHVCATVHNEGMDVYVSLGERCNSPFFTALFQGGTDVPSLSIMPCVKVHGQSRGRS